MSFCGTIGRYDGKFLTFALECCVLNDVLLELADKPKNPRRIDPTQLFPVSAEDRERFTKLAKNLKHFLPEEISRRSKTLKVFARDLEFDSYEFYEFFKHALDVKDVKARITDLEKIGAGTPLKDYEPMIKFLSRLNSYGLSKHNSFRGGCF